jgi:voltage-gated potassium channel
MMLVGIALIGVVTASVAAWFVSLTSSMDEEDDDVRDVRDDAMAQRVVDLEAKIDRLLEIQDPSSASRDARDRG